MAKAKKTKTAVDGTAVERAWKRACCLRDDVDHIVGPARDTMTAISATTPGPNDPKHAEWNAARYVYETCVMTHRSLVELCGKLYCTMTYGHDMEDGNDD